VSLHHQHRYSDSWGDCNCSCHTSALGAAHVAACCGPDDGPLVPKDGHGWITGAAAMQDEYADEDAERHLGGRI
jgi:hypothetical protein